jgi:hypothetical protein
MTIDTAVFEKIGIPPFTAAVKCGYFWSKNVHIQGTPTYDLQKK